MIMFAINKLSFKFSNTEKRKLCSLNTESMYTKNIHKSKSNWINKPRLLYKITMQMAHVLVLMASGEHA